MSVRNLTAVAICTFIFAACSKHDGSEYVGKWTDKSGNIAEFVKDGDAIFLVVPSGDKFPATLNKDNSLQVSGRRGDMLLSYAKSSDSIFSDGKELKRTTQTAEEELAAKAAAKQEQGILPLPEPVKGNAFEPLKITR